jgi:hypothetical protein
MATPPAVAAICFIRLGCCACIGDAIMGAAAGACAGTWLGAARGAGAAMRGAGARIGGEAERPRRGIFIYWLWWWRICKTTMAHQFIQETRIDLYSTAYD